MASVPHRATRPRGLPWFAFALVLVIVLVVVLLDLDDTKPFASAVARGRLIVAVPSQPAPALFVGKVDRSIRAPDAFAASLAQDIGHRVGLPVELRLADFADARAAVQDGRADIAIAGLDFAPDASISFAPTAYSSGRGVALVLRHGTFEHIADLANAPVCITRVSPYAARLHRMNLQRYDRPLDALLAFQAGECAALVDDEFVIHALLKQVDWSYYRVLPGSIDAAPAFIATRGGDMAGVAFIDDTVKAWRRQRWLETVRRDRATQLAFDMFNAQNDLYCH
jgi:polar amino acid transport system substrate-binding protein